MLHTVLLALTIAVGAQDTVLVQPLPGLNKQIVAYVTNAHMKIVVPNSTDTLHFLTRVYTSLQPATVRSGEARCTRQPGFLADSVYIRAWVSDTVTFEGTVQVPASLSPRHRLLFPLRAKVETVLEMLFINVPLSPCGDLDGTVFFGFGVHRKEHQTQRNLNSGQSITGEQLRRGGNVSLEGLLQARYPGVRIREVTGGIYFEIRGAPALCVIDGTPLKAGPRGVCPIVPNDIETIEILKEPVATSRYNLQGGEGGVVLITTRLRR